MKHNLKKANAEYQLEIQELLNQIERERNPFVVQKLLSEISKIKIKIKKYE